MDGTRRSFLWRGALALPMLLARPAEASARIDVRERGARGDGRTPDTRAIQAAIDAAAPAGALVDVPPGDYVCGTLRLRNRTTIRLAAGATLIASPDDADFDRPVAKGRETFADEETSDHRFALLQGQGISRVRIVGPGRIDGNRTSRSGPKPIALRECAEVEIRDLTIANAGNYAIGLLGCEGVGIQGVTILNGYADGIDPDCCRNVRISRCHVESRDDALCLKTSFALGVRRATENVRIWGCRLSTLHNAIKLGTESTGDFRNIAISDCVITGRRHAWKGDLTSGISLQSVDGGTLERVAVWNVRMANVRAPIFVRLARRGRGQRIPTPGALRDVSIWDVVASGARIASSVTGIPDRAVERLSLRRIRVRAAGGGEVVPGSLNIPEMERRYPDATMFHDLPAVGLYGRHVVGLTVEDVDVTVDQPDARPALVFDDVRDLRVRALRAESPAAGGPMVWLHAVRGAQLRDLRPDAGGKTVARVSGAETAKLRVARRAADHVVQVDADVRAAALEVDGRAIATAGGSRP